MFADLLELESEPTRRWVALDQIGRRVSDMTPEWLADCADVVHAVRGLAFGPPPLVQHVVEAARKALEAIASSLVACYRREFHALTDAHREAIASALQALGRDGVESLVRGLETEEDWEIRKTFLVFLTTRGREAVPALLRRLGDPSWYLVRNALVILGDIGDPATVPALGGSLEHADARVKRDAVVALGKIGGARAVELLQERLDDEDVAEVAARALAALDRPGTVGALLRKTAAVDLFGRGHRRIAEAISALAALGADESVPRLHEILKRRLWLPPSAGDDVRIAAARALRRIGTSDALQAVSDGTRLWRRPVREACLDLASDPAEAGRN
jgi:HEAT repeat protein